MAHLPDISFQVANTAASIHGGTYEGSFLPGTSIPDGYGMIRTSTYGYRGGFKAGAFEGHGWIQFNFDGTGAEMVKEYTGGFSKNHFNGQGRAAYYPFLSLAQGFGGCNPIQFHGLVYDGGWVNSQKCGYGVMTSSLPGTTYIGGWNKDSQEGYGTVFSSQYAYPCYDGGWKRGKKEGYGKLFGADGTCNYEGGFKDDKQEGWGKYLAFDGNLYQGYWENGIRIA